MKSRLYWILVFLVLPLFAVAGDSSGGEAWSAEVWLEYKSIFEDIACPESIEVSHFLDGGTYGVSVLISGKELLFSIDRIMVIIQITEGFPKEREEEIEVHRRQHVYLGVSHPTDSGAIKVPFRSAEEEVIENAIRRCISCDVGDQSSLQAILRWFSSDRMREVEVIPSAQQVDGANE